MLHKCYCKIQHHVALILRNYKLYAADNPDYHKNKFVCSIYKLTSYSITYTMLDSIQHSDSTACMQMETNIGPVVQ